MNGDGVSGGCSRVACSSPAWVGRVERVKRERQAPLPLFTFILSQLFTTKTQTNPYIFTVRRATSGLPKLSEEQARVCWIRSCISAAEWKPNSSTSSQRIALFSITHASFDDVSSRTFLTEAADVRASSHRHLPTHTKNRSCPASSPPTPSNIPIPRGDRSCASRITRRRSQTT